MKYHPKKVAENALHKAKDYLAEQLDRLTCLLGAEFGFRSDDSTLNQRKKFELQLCNGHPGSEIHS